MSTSADIWFPEQLFIDGTWCRADTSNTFAVRNPANGQTISNLPKGATPEAQQAVAAAANALSVWRDTPAPVRCNYLKAIELVIRQNRARLARLLTLEQGKILAQAEAEVDYAASFYLWFAEEARRIDNHVVPHPDPEKQSLVEYTPLGVIGAITPWNFPLAQAAKKIAAALAAGCTMVLKPSEETPLMGLATAWLAKEAKLPAGVLNVICGDAPAIGSVLMAAPEVRGISVTGSVRTGQLLMRESANQLKRVSLELGGNAPFIVCRDADLDFTLDALIKLKFMVSGQVCVTANRVFVHEEIAEPFTQRLVQAVCQLAVGSGLAEASQVGPLATSAQRDKVAATVEHAVSLGAQLLCGGHTLEDGEHESGYFYAPTVLNMVTNDMEICQEEIFGPVVTLQTFSCEDDMVQRANDSKYGLAAYVFSGDVARATQLARRIDAGIIGVNDLRPLRAEVPFGGVKMSGIGREGGREGLYEFLEARVIGIHQPSGAV